MSFKDPKRIPPLITTDLVPDRAMSLLLASVLVSLCFGLGVLVPFDAFLLMS